MKLLHDRPDEDVNAITACTADSVTINGVVWRESVLVPSSGTVEALGRADFAALSADDFGRAGVSKPALVVFGSGARIRFPSAEHLRPLIEAGIGLETMDTIAACRTYSILVSERRKVVAMLLFGG